MMLLVNLTKRRFFRNFVVMVYRLLVFLILLWGADTALALDFKGLVHPAVEVKPEASSGLENVYVVFPEAQTSIEYRASTSTVEWYRFSTLGAAYAESVAASAQGNVWTIPFSAQDMGYMIVDGSTTHYYWIVDYASHAFSVSELTTSPSEDDCNRAAITVEGTAAAIPYTGINGRRFELSRELSLSYNTVAFNEESFSYEPVEKRLTLAGITGSINIEAPLCNTIFILTGDRFLRAWSQEQSVESSLYITDAVAATTKAENTGTQPDNEQHGNADNGLGGSAPATVSFNAAVSDAVVFQQWQISRSPEFADIVNTFAELDFEYTFTEAGTTYVRFLANNASGTCPYEGTVYEVFVGESRLDIPNAFSPGGTPGVNDEWKVSYKSLVQYECHIFNRWGKELFSSKDPSQGWDGKVNGKTVPAGAYYYVIEARGADGIKYKRAGDINIINFFDSGNSGSQSTEQ